MTKYIGEVHFIVHKFVDFVFVRSVWMELCAAKVSIHFNNNKEKNRQMIEKF